MRILRTLGGLSRFKVVDGNTRAISFLFQDATGGDAKQYSLKLHLASVGSVTLYSIEDDKYRLVGIMPSNGPPVTTAVYIRNESTGVDFTSGSIYFQWDSTNSSR
jgi:hypothetical protein